MPSPSDRHPSAHEPDLVGTLEMSAELINAKRHVAQVVGLVHDQTPQFEMIARNAWVALVHLERCLVEHYQRQAGVE